MSLETADLLSANGRYEEAIIAYNQILEDDPNNALAYNNKAIALSELGKMSEAMENHCKAIEISSFAPYTIISTFDTLQQIYYLDEIAQMPYIDLVWPEHDEDYPNTTTVTFTINGVDHTHYVDESGELVPSE